MLKKKFFQYIYLCWRIDYLGLSAYFEQLTDLIPDGSLFSFEWRKKCDYLFVRYGYMVKLIYGQGFSEALVQLIPKELILSSASDWQRQVDEFVYKNGRLLDNPDDSMDWWTRWYDLVGLGPLEIDKDILATAIPGYWNIPVSTGMNFKHLWPAINNFFSVLSLDFDLNKLVIKENERSAEEGAYLFSLQKRKDSEKKGVAIGYTTLVEEMLFYLYLWSLTGEHLIRTSLVVCCGTSVAVPNGKGNPCLLSWQNSELHNRHNLLLIDSEDIDPYFHNNRGCELRLVWQQQ